MSRMKTLCAMESLVEGVPQINFIICPAEIEDCDQIYELVQEYYSEYGIPSSRQLNKDKDVIIGFVLWFRPFENTTGQRVFLEALYVSKPYRQKYVEQALFEKTIQIY
ncbi:uncharacterized protein LOC113560770 isoform X2 [Rhopalosiphum maidis]|uniref:uncharacterized protein LOC113560770 isoform X2 n=1 Tax=Rhopalosiphum maidis TaxID=43146 RepID=UPI000F00A197|nr:uncharacterized protein LOC113560770 isoform X2 [Rhopalosiphum maidis]